MLLAFMLGVLMYADDLLLISSTCSDLRRMLRTVFSKPMAYNTVTFNTSHPYGPLKPVPLNKDSLSEQDDEEH